MKKIKLMIASLIGAIALVFACVFSFGVNAAESTTNYTYDFHSSVKNPGTKSVSLVAANKDEDFYVTSAENSSAKMMLNISNTSDKAFNATKSNGHLEFQKNSSGNRSATLTISFRSMGDVTITSKINTGKKDRPYIYSIDSGAEQKDLMSGTSGGTEFTFEFKGAGNHTLFFREATTAEYEGDYSNMKIYSFTLVDHQVVEDSATIVGFQQEGKDGAYTYVRFVYIASGYTDLSSAKLTNALTLVLDAGTENEKTVTRTPKVVTKITNNGSTYVGTPDDASYEFDNATNTNDVYIIYVVKFTTATYKTHTIKAVLNYGSPYASAATPYTFTE